MIGIAWLTYVTHRNYKPIQSIINKIDSFSLQMNKKIGGSKPEEFNFILTALDKLIEQSNDYEKQHKDDLVHRRKLFSGIWLMGRGLFPRNIGRQRWNDWTCPMTI